MPTSLTTLQLEKFTGLFKDETSFRQFTTALTEAADATSGKLLLVGEKVVGELISPTTAAERLRAAVLRKLLKNPATVETLVKRLESDDLVD
jgi:hypothetical protein